MSSSTRPSIPHCSAIGPNSRITVTAKDTSLGDFAVLPHVLTILVASDGGRRDLSAVGER